MGLRVLFFISRIYFSCFCGTTLNTFSVVGQIGQFYFYRKCELWLVKNAIFEFPFCELIFGFLAGN